MTQNIRKIHMNEDLDTRPAVATLTAYRIAFATKKIEPMGGLPDFPYQPSALNHDSIEYVAILYSSSIGFAQDAIRNHWPEANFIYAHSGESFEFESSAMLVTVLGCVPAKPPPKPLKRGLGSKCWHFFFSTKPF